MVFARADFLNVLWASHRAGPAVGCSNSLGLLCKGISDLAEVDESVRNREEQAARELLGHFHPGEIVREEAADLLRARRLSEHVQRRHQ